MKWPIAIGGLIAAATSHWWFHLNPIPGLIMTIIVLAAMKSRASQ